MSRIAPADPALLPDPAHSIAKEVLKGGKFDNLVLAMAHQPQILEHMFGLLLSFRTSALLPLRIHELVVVTVAKVNQCKYCLAHHTSLLEVEGMTTEGIERLPNDIDDHPELSDLERNVLRYAVAVTERANRMRDEEVDRLKEHLSDAQIVELTWRIALSGAFNRFNDALQTDME